MSDKIRYFTEIETGSVYTLEEMKELHTEDLLIENPFHIQDYLDSGCFEEVEYIDGLPNVIINEVNIYD